MNIFQETFSTGKVVKAANITNAKLQSWMRRDLIVGHRKKAPIGGGGAPGSSREFSYFNVMEIAVAEAVLQVGSQSVEEAFHIAMGFAHMGNGASFWAGEEEPPLPRDPGMPFNPHVHPGCQTLLCVAGTASVTVPWKPGSDAYIDARHKLHNPASMVIIEIDPIYERVVKALGHNPWEVKQFCYSKVTEA